MGYAQKTLKNHVFKFRYAWVKSNSAAIRPPIFFQVAKTLICMACIQTFSKKSKMTALGIFDQILTFSNAI
jgi:hypothetical protein